MQAELNVSISHFTLMKFHASDVVARVNYKPGMFTLNSAVFSAMQGRVSGNGAVILDVNNNLIVKGTNFTKRKSISNNFFYSFWQFWSKYFVGQTFKWFFNRRNSCIERMGQKYVPEQKRC
ncbi:MAG: hypothetical protein HC905_13225 [Bacteroidales bacterium]|nr:hypothetical protein [Bacteroidales bacterium]